MDIYVKGTKAKCMLGFSQQYPAIARGHPRGKKEE